MIQISTSILSSENRPLAIKKLNETNTDYVHIDVMDGKFVPKKEFPIEEIKTLLPLIKKKIDIHLMVENPENYIKELNYNNIEYITIHCEISSDIEMLINTIKKKGYKVGIAISPKTKINKIKNFINIIDMVLIMSVTPGEGGQKFLKSTTKKLKEINKLNKNINISIDGGINSKTIKKVKKYINIAVIGSYIINSNNYNETINNLKN